jgi:hypothetical protein
MHLMARLVSAWDGVKPLLYTCVSWSEGVKEGWDEYPL